MGATGNKARPSPQHEKLSYFVTLRQMQTDCEILRKAYERLAILAQASVGWNIPTVILDWLETELRLLRGAGEDGKAAASELMKAAVTLSNALKQ